MPFNFRVVRSEGVFHGEPWEYYAMHEVYYDRDKEGNVDESDPRSASADPVPVSSEEGVDGLRWLLNKMLAGLDKPVIEMAVFERPQSLDIPE